MEMNLESPLGEDDPLQGMFDGVPGQSGGATVVQYTTVNLPPEPPKDHIIWSLCCFVYTWPCCCFGLAALIFSVKARDRKVVGDLDGARHYGSTACCLNTFVTVLVSLAILIALIVIIVVVVQANRASQLYTSYDTIPRYNWNG